MIGLIRHKPGVNWGLMNVGDEIDRMFEDFTMRNEESGKFWAPSVDIAEENDKLVLTAEIPGVDKKDVRINLHDNVLTIEGEKNHVTEEKQDKYYRCERDYGKFSRSFTLPAKIDADKIEAAFKDGILTITLPKAEEAKPHQITIN